MKQYYIQRGRFRNEYSLYWAETPEEIQLAVENAYERISRQEAISFCRAERRRRKENPAFSGYADAHIFPIQPQSAKEYMIDGYLFTPAT